MKIHYDRDEDAMMIEFVQNGDIEYAEQSGPLIPHFSNEGQLILLEILQASDFLSSLIKASLRDQDQELILPME